MKLDLPTVTLVSVHGVDPDAAAKVLRYCIQFASFGSVRLLSSRPPSFSLGEIEFHLIKAINYCEYNQFVMHELVKYVETQHCLIVQPDGFISNPAGWEACFLDYDYIGAPWPLWAEWCPLCRVGNGGFSLRSKKLLNVTSRLEYCGGNEDYVITNHYYRELIDNSIRIAPVEIAVRFSCELKCDDLLFDPLRSFGFHGKQYSTYLQRLEDFGTWDV